MREKNFKAGVFFLSVGSVIYFLLCTFSVISWAADLPNLRTFSEPSRSILADQWFLSDYESIVIRNQPDQEKLYFDCAARGDHACAIGFGSILSERVFVGIPTKYSNAEILFIVHGGLCDPRLIEDNTRDGEKLICQLNYSLATRYISKFYELGILGLPKDKELSECWLNKSLSEQYDCGKLEVEKYGATTQGVKPKGFH